MSAPDNPHSKPPIQPRSALTRKSDGEEEEAEGKPTLARRASSNMPTRQERIIDALNRLDDARLKTLTTRIGADELAVAIGEADNQLKSRIAACLDAEQLALFKEYLQIPKDRFPGDVIDGVQGKLLRLAL